MFDKTLPVCAAADLFMRSRAFSLLPSCIKSRFHLLASVCRPSVTRQVEPLHQKASPGLQLHCLSVFVNAAVNVGGGEAFIY